MRTWLVWVILSVVGSAALPVLAGQATEQELQRWVLRLPQVAEHIEQSKLEFPEAENEEFFAFSLLHREVLSSRKTGEASQYELVVARYLDLPGSRGGGQRVLAIFDGSGQSLYERHGVWEVEPVYGVVPDAGLLHIHEGYAHSGYIDEAHLFVSIGGGFQTRYSVEISSASSMGREQQVAFAYVDLDGDGPKEIIQRHVKLVDTRYQKYLSPPKGRKPEPPETITFTAYGWDEEAGTLVEKTVEPARLEEAWQSR